MSFRNKLGNFIKGLGFVENDEPANNQPGVQNTPSEIQNQVDVILPPTAGQRAVPTPESQLKALNSRYKLVEPDYDRSSVLLIRNLVKHNADFGMAMNNVVSLGNTGWKIFLDTDVKPEVADKMREHLRRKIKQWASHNFTSPSGLVDKMFKQLMIGGAIATEWVPQKDLGGFENIFFLKPEKIEFLYNSSTKKYIPYQRTDSGIATSFLLPDLNLVKLNTLTFRYLGISGDTDLPYGIPPFLTALEPTQLDDVMYENIAYIVEQLGIWGFLEVLLEKPGPISGESKEAYRQRLESHLVQAKNRVMQGYKDGISVGYNGDVEFKFNSTSKEGKGVRDLYGLNWARKIRGLKSDTALFGGDDSRSETQIAIVFTKMLAELQGYQNLVKENLEFGFERELLMAGFKFNKLSIRFNNSTLQDALKFEQAREVRIRNNHAMYWDGVQSLDDYAEDMGFEKPDEKKPRASRGAEGGGPSKEAKEKEDREKSKDSSDRSVRDKNKPQGTKK